MGSEKSVAGIPAWIVDGYRSFCAKDFESNRELYERLAAEGQKPKALWVGCSDSRVIPEKIMGAAAGDVFVVRNVANIVPPINMGAHSSGAAIEYAVGALGINDIIVCGHEGCGGVKALIDGVDESAMPHLSRWIHFSRATKMYEDSQKAAHQQKLEMLVKANAVQQIEHLRSYPCVMDAKKSRGLRIHVLYYKMGTGELQAYDREEEIWVDVER